MDYRDISASVCELLADGQDSEAETVALTQLGQLNQKTIDIQGVQVVLEEFKAARAFDSLVRVAEHVQTAGVSDSRITALYAQGLIDQGNVASAISVLENAQTTSDPSVQSEIFGLLGRAHKQQFVEAYRSGDLAKKSLQRSILHYRELYRQDPAWHGANLVALVHRAESEGIKLPSGASSATLAKRVIAEMDKIQSNSDGYEWVLAAKGEVSLALEDWEQVGRYYSEFANHPATRAFHLGSATRQLREIWGATVGDDGMPSRVLAQLDIKLIGMVPAQRALDDGSQATLVSLHPGERAGLRKIIDGKTRGSDTELFRGQEALFDDSEMTAVSVARGLLERASGVCRVVNRFAGTQSGGSGFLVDGASIHESLHGPLLITNAHVLSTNGLGKSTKPRDAVVISDETNLEIDVGELIFESEQDSLDVTVASLKLDHLAIETLGLIPIHGDDRPLSDGETDSFNDSVFTMGHPKGGELSLGLGGSRVRDHEFYRLGNPFVGYRRIHYRTPTEEGVSGGPVLDQFRFQAIGVHRAWSDTPLRPSVSNGYRANEAVAMKSIIRAIGENIDV